MQTRVEKYNREDPPFPPKRSSKNTSLYEEIKNSELDNFNIGSNAKVIGDNESQINIDKIKEILEKNYQDPPRQRRMKLELPEYEEEVPKLEETREYDINAILEQAREEKEVDYQKERLKKIRDTQYDILKNLELEAKSKEESNEKTKEELLELINTININESQSKNGKKLKEILEEEKKETEEHEDIDPLDILTELKGDDETIVSGAKEFTEEMEKFEVDSMEIKVGNREKQEGNTKEFPEIKVKEKEETMDDSFYSSNGEFNSKDFADLEVEEGSGLLVKILIVVIFLAIVAGLVLFLNEFLNLGWF